MKNIIKIFIKEDILLSTAIAIVLGLFAPLDFYYSNKSDVWYDVYNIFLGVMIITGLIFIGVSVILLAGRLLSGVIKCLSGILHIIFVFLLVAFYIQGNYIPVPYGALNGTPIVWADYKAYDWLSVFFWICIFAIILLLAKAFKEKKCLLIERGAEMILVLISLFTLLFEFCVMDGNEYKYNKHSEMINEWTYSKDTNFNILILDCFDSRLFTDMLRDDEEFLKLAEQLDGFTYYRDTVGTYNLTDYAIPSILTGQLYLAQSTYGEYVDNAYEESRFIQKLTEDKYSKNLYTTITVPQGEISDEFENLSKIRLRPIYEEKFIIDMYKMVAFRYMPTPLKKYFYRSFFEVGANKTADVNRSESDTEPYDWNNIVWDNINQAEEYELIDTKMFHMFHLQGIHEPRQYHSNYEFTSNPDEVSIEECALLNMKIVVDWIERLKREGLYDNSVIVIMGDHGTVNYQTEANVAQSPILLIKGIDERHMPVVNNLPVSYLDLQTAFVELCEGNSSNDLFSNVCNELGVGDSNNYIQSMDSLLYGEDNLSEEVGRWRMFYFTYLMNEMDTDSWGGPFIECATNKKSYSDEGVIQTGNEY